MKSLLVVQIQEAVWRKLNILKPLFSRKKSLTFQKRSKKMLSHQRANLADQPINNNRRKLIYVSRPLVMKQTFDRHMSKMFDQPSQSGLLTSGLFKILEFLQAFPFFPSTSPFFLSFFFLLFFFFLALVPFIARPKISTENPVPRSFFSPKRNGNACYAGVCNPIQSYFLPPGKGGGDTVAPASL